MGFNPILKAGGLLQIYHLSYFRQFISKSWTKKKKNEKKIPLEFFEQLS